MKTISLIETQFVAGGNTVAIAVFSSVYFSTTVGLGLLLGESILESIVPLTLTSCAVGILLGYPI